MGGINDDTPGKSKTNSQIKFKDLMLKSSVCGYRDAYILVSGTRTATTDIPNNFIKKSSIVLHLIA